MSCLLALIEEHPERPCQQKLQRGDAAGKDRPEPQTAARQVQDAAGVSLRAAAGQLRDQQLGERKDDRGREHKDRKDHRVDGAVGGHGGAGRAAAAFQPERDEQLLQRPQAGAQIIAQRQRNAEPAQPARQLRGLWDGRILPEVLPHQKPQPHGTENGGASAAEKQRAAGTFQLGMRPEPEQQERQRQRDEPLRDLHAGQPSELPARREVAAQHADETFHRQ